MKKALAISGGVVVAIVLVGIIAGGRESTPGTPTGVGHGPSYPTMPPTSSYRAVEEDSLAASGIAPGTYEVSVDIQPGKYRSPAPSGELVKLCYFHVKRGDDYLDQGVANEGPSRVTIKASWTGAEFKTSGCQPWQKVS